MLMPTFNQNRFRVIVFAAFACSISMSLVSAQETTRQSKQDIQQTTFAVPIETVVILGPSNSRIRFVGTHVGDDPKPRLGGFGEFNGLVKVDAARNMITSIAVDINVDSVWTEFVKLTAHLKNADFFETAKFPHSRFVSTEVKMAAEGKYTVTGNLTLHGQTKSITFPADYRFENGGLLFTCTIQLDRSLFGMDQMLSGVEEMVELEIFVGKKTTIPPAQDGHGGDSKKKQSKVDPASKRRQVSISLPNMT